MSLVSLVLLLVLAAVIVRGTARALPPVGTASAREPGTDELERMRDELERVDARLQRLEEERDFYERLLESPARGELRESSRSGPRPASPEEPGTNADPRDSTDAGEASTHDSPRDDPTDRRR